MKYFFYFLGESSLLFTNIKVGSDKVKYKKVYQRNTKDCGVACLLSIIKYYKGCNTFENIRYLTKCNDNGITALNLIEASKKLGFSSKGLKCNYEDLYDLQKPLICHLLLKNGYNHYVVLYKISKKEVLIFDPYYGLKKYKKEEFLSVWTNIVIELKQVRKLDFIKENNTYYLKEIISKNKIIYFIIIIVSLFIVFISLLNSSYFKVLIESNNTHKTFFIFLYIIVFKEIITLFRNKTLIKLESNVLRQLNINTHKRLLSLPCYYFNSRTTGDIITKFNDLEYIKNLLVNVPICMFIDITLLIFTSVILIKINLKLFIIFLISCLSYLIILVFNNKKQKNLIEINQESNSIKNTYLSENINCIDTIKNMNISDLRHKIFKNVYNNYIKSMINYEKLYTNISFIKNIILYITINLILYLGIDMVNNNIITLSSLILFNSLMIYFIEPLNEIYELFPLIKKGINAARRVGEVYSINSHTKNIKELNNYDIKINNLSFSYDGYNKILKGINECIKEKEKVIVLGESGCGKSTLFKLLSGIYDVEEGSILIGDNNIKDVNTNDIITYVSENERLFNDTIRNNIVLNNNVDDIDNIIKITKVNKVLEKKNITLDNIIEESGTNFSKGEKQKIILSRALIKNSNILIFDESLSGVEIEEEYEIMKNILKHFKDKTIIYISHSKVCIPLFNKIINFDNKEDLWSYQKLN